MILGKAVRVGSYWLSAHNGKRQVAIIRIRGLNRDRDGAVRCGGEHTIAKVGH